MRSLTLANGHSIMVHEAPDAVARMRGLIGQTSIPAGEGLLLKGKQVHTFGMRFSIDAIYLGRAGSVLKVVTLAPRRVGPFMWSAKKVLEMGEGEASRAGILPGMTLAL
ncbi:MAG: DUF192 domain-containing protein [Actinomycetota bacterium]